jgi:hypothetical protein
MWQSVSRAISKLANAILPFDLDKSIQPVTQSQWTFG